MQELFSAAIHYAFGMPLDGDDGKRHMHDALHDVVSGAAYYGQILSKLLYGLMVGGVDQCARAVQLIEEVHAVKSAVIDIVLLILSCPVMGVGGVDVLCDRSAQMDIDQLQSFAYAQYGLFLCHKRGERLNLQDIQFRVDVMGTMVLLPEEGGRNVAAARQEQMAGL